MMAEYRLPRPGFRHQCRKVRGSGGRKDEEVRGDEPQKRCLITQNKTFNTTSTRLFFGGVSLSSSAVVLSLSDCISSLLLDSRLEAGWRFSTLSGNHWNQIQVLIIIHLPTDSPLVSEPALPLARSAFPRPPRHRYISSVYLFYF